MKLELANKLLDVLNEYKALDIENQIDYKKFYLYSIIAHSTAIEGSTVTELEAQLLFDEGITSSKRTLAEQLMNLDLKNAYEHSMKLAKQHTDFSVAMLKDLSRLVMNHLQYEFGLIPAKIIKEDKVDYIKSLIDSKELESLEPFRDFMFEEHIKNLVNEIKAYKKSQDFDPLALS